MLCLVVFFSFVFCICAECPAQQYNRHLYDELFCEPLFEQPGPCPSSYDCSTYLNFRKQGCMYLNRTYATGATLEIADLGCFQNCVCVGPQFQCDIKQCTIKSCSNCRRVYQNDTCCPSQQICSDKPLGEHNYQGAVYYTGQKFNTDRCTTCVFKQSGGSSLQCRPINCGASLLAPDMLLSYCAPVYDVGSPCCPVDIICPERCHIVESEMRGKTQLTHQQCRFGVSKVSAMSEVVVGHPDVQCFCHLPPLLTCYKFKRSSCQQVAQSAPSPWTAWDQHLHRF